MSCKPLLDRYAEGTLSPKLLAAVASHLELCAECVAIFEELKVVDALLTTIRVPATQPNFTFAVMAEVRSMPVPTIPRLNVAALLGGYITIAWVIIALWLRLAGVSAQGALANTSAAASQFFGAFHAITSSAMGSFGHGAPLLTTFVVSVRAEAGAATANSPSSKNASATNKREIM
ncbi:MAG: zf-HC2 domain-containing protein, partial [Candidatus Eremiobacteraeota bacterium]|nr:zf-HC2 domain-containing protein [Candidatus Eremiobacteraeota bacterium]